MEKFKIWDKLKNAFNWLRSIFFNKELEISIVGLQNAGKSTFVNVLANYKFDEDTIPTIGFNFRTIKKGKVQFKLWDLGGQPRFRDSWEKYCRTSDVIIYVCDSADVGNFDVAKLQLHQLLAWPSLNGIPLVILGNKNDLDGSLSEKDLVNTLDLNSIKDREIAVYSISCKNMINIDKVLKLLSNFNKK
jgi:ADP-ribosylation factor-like protein 8